MVLGRVPRAVLVAAERAQDLRQVDAALQRNPVLSVAGEHVVGVAQHARRADLGRLLAERGNPQTQLALTLKAGGFVVEGPREHHVAPESAQVLSRDVLREGREPGVLDALARAVKKAYESLL